MPAPKGHEKWGNPLKPKKLTPKQLWNGACEYFEESNKSPVQKMDYRGKDPEVVYIDIERPYSIEGLCNSLDISVDTFTNYSKVEGYETYFGVCARIRQIIDEQHFTYGTTGIFNSNIVMSKLGLAEKKELKAQIQETEVELDIG
jgi:hypothetical protein